MAHALRDLDDARLRREPSPVTIELADDGLTLGGFALAKADGFDDERITALLAAAYGDNLPPRTVAYFRGALTKQREGQTALAQTYLALAGLPPLADPFETTWRLSAADGLMKAGVGPAVIVDVLSPGASLGRAYNPDQPRVPKGNGRNSGQWTSEDRTASNDSSGSRRLPSASETTQSAQPIQVADNSFDWAQYLSPVDSAEAAETGGPAPNAQHKVGVDQAISQYRALGYQIFSDQPVAVDISGFDTPRVYDFVVRDPDTTNLIGVEVKTTRSF